MKKPSYRKFMSPVFSKENNDTPPSESSEEEFEDLDVDDDDDDMEDDDDFLCDLDDDDREFLVADDLDMEMELAESLAPDMKNMVMSILKKREMQSRDLNHSIHGASSRGNSSTVHRRNGYDNMSDDDSDFVPESEEDDDDDYNVDDDHDYEYHDETAVCTVCSKSAARGTLLECKKCCSYVHVKCCGLPHASFADVVEDWNCNACVRCAFCARNGNLIRCNKCSAAFHKQCLPKSLRTPYTDRWMCQACKSATTPEKAKQIQSTISHFLKKPNKHITKVPESPQPPSDNNNDNNSSGSTTTIAVLDPFPLYTSHYNNSSKSTVEATPTPPTPNSPSMSSTIPIPKTTPIVSPIPPVTEITSMVQHKQDLEQPTQFKISFHYGDWKPLFCRNISIQNQSAIYQQLLQRINQEISKYSQHLRFVKMLSIDRDYCGFQVAVDVNDQQFLKLSGNIEQQQSSPTQHSLICLIANKPIA